MNFISDLNHYNLAHWLGFNGELSSFERLFPLLHPQDLFLYLAFILEYLVLKIIMKWLMFQKGTNL